jgi:hypothetical protein
VNAGDWKDIAMIVLGALGALLTGITSMVWAKIQKLEDSTDDKFSRLPETYARRDDTKQLEDRIMSAIDGIRDTLNQILQKVK